MLAQRRLRIPRLLWVGPLAVLASVVGVVLVQVAALLILEPQPPFLRDFTEPIAFTAVLVGIGVLVFAVVNDSAERPVRTYRRIAFAALVVSIFPDVALGMGWVFRNEGWPLASVFIAMHVVAWATTVGILTRLGTNSAADAPDIVRSVQAVGGPPERHG